MLFLNIIRKCMFKISHSSLTDIQTKSAFYLIWGRCYTILPLIQTTSSGLVSGYSVMLPHAETLYNRSEGDPEEGWHIFLHPATDPWIGKKNNNGLINLYPLAIQFLQCPFILAVRSIIFLIPRIASMSWKAVKHSERGCLHLLGCCAI